MSDQNNDILMEMLQEEVDSISNRYQMSLTEIKRLIEDWVESDKAIKEKYV